MSFNIGNMGGGSVEQLDVGSYAARVQGIVSYGIQPQTDWQTGEPKAPEKRIAITFEFPTEAVDRELEDGTVVKSARRLTKEFKVSNHKKSGLMGVIMATNPNADNLTDILDTTCSVTIGRTSSGKAKVSSVAPLMKGVDVDDLNDGTVAFDFYEPSEDAFIRLTSWQQGVIMGANDYTGFADDWVNNEGDY